MYRYRSPLQDDEFYEVYRQYERSYGPPRPLRPYPPMLPPPVQYRQRPGPYSRPLPPPTSSGPTYSSRYKLSSYPRELNAMFGAMECKLCCVEVTSPIGAKMHYSGKPHMKKVKTFLTDWSKRTGKPIPNFDQYTPQASVSSLADYCELCDVKLLTTNDKMLHYSGKNHRRNERDPANARKKGKTYETIDLSATDSRFGIGIGFSSDSKELVVPKDLQVNDFVCDICDVKAQSQEQLNVHLTGKKHQEKVKKKESGLPKTVRPFQCDICNVSLDTAHLLNLHLNGKPHAKVMKKLEEEYQGGSCDVCDVVFNSYKDYYNHVNGKKHEKKMRQNVLRNPEIVKDKKEAITCKYCDFIGDPSSHSCEKSLEMKEEEEEEESTSEWKCIPCYNTVFETEQDLERHKQTRRHLLCMLNVEGDKIVEEKIHFYCFTCRKQYNDNKEYCNHLFSHKHMTLSDERLDISNKTDLWHCRVCAIVMDQEAKDEHDKSKAHLIQAAQQDITRQLTELANEHLNTNVFNCVYCNVKFINFVAFSEHMLDPKHLEDMVCEKIMKAGLKIE